MNMNNFKDIDWFESWFDSHYYHLLYQNRDETEALNFINILIKKLNPHQKSTIFDLACGKGRHSKALADNGFIVTGVDLSENSIIAAKEYESESLQFYTHDMRFPFRTNYFDYTFNFFTSFGYFNTEREHINALKTMSASLKKTGVLVIDFLNTSLPSLNNASEEVKIIEGFDFQINKWATDNHLFKTIKVFDSKNTLQISFEERVARFNLEKFKYLFSKSELILTDVFGDHSLNEFDEETSPRLILFAKKKVD